MREGRLTFFLAICALLLHAPTGASADETTGKGVSRDGGSKRIVDVQDRGEGAPAAGGTASGHNLFQAIQTLGIISALLFTFYQVRRFHKETDKQRYLELDKRYNDFLNRASELDDPPLGYDMSLVQHFMSQGGTKKELLVYDQLFSVWESAFLLYQRRGEEQWLGWQKWIRAFFVARRRTQLAWEIAGRFFDQRFADFIDREVIKSLDPRVTQAFPESVEAWNSLPAVVVDDTLWIGSFQVMQRWERPIMRSMADIVGREGADVLEVGFGLGMSAEYIQEKPIRSHTILEPHPTVFRTLDRWARERKNVRAINSSWESWASSANAGSFDAILFDTYPLRRSELHKNHFPFFREAASLLRDGGVFTYYTDESSHVCSEHQRELLRWFEEFTAERVEVHPPEDCDYWQADQMLVISARKRARRSHDTSQSASDAAGVDVKRDRAEDQDGEPPGDGTCPEPARATDGYCEPQS